LNETRLAVVGGTVVDLILLGIDRLPAWPRHTEFTSSNLVTFPAPPLLTLGGNGANAAFVASRCGATVTLHTTIASDTLGRLARGWLENAGCEIRSPRAASTAVNVTAADRRFRRATFFHPGVPAAMPRLSAATAARRPHAALVCGWPHPPLEQIAGEFAALRRQNVLTAIDVGPFLTRPWRLAALEPVLASLDLFLANAHEVKHLARVDTLPAALRRLRRHHRGHIVIKRGPAGALWIPAGEDRAQAVPAKRVQTLNTIGAGDSFNGALLAALLGGAPFPSALRQANEVAARVVASPGGVLAVKPSRRSNAGASPRGCPSR